MKNWCMTLLTAAILACALPAMAGTVTIDMNGFPNASGGQVTGPGLEKPIQITPKAAQVVMEGLQGGATYAIDFFFNSGPGSSDFTFKMNEAGTGVASVSKGGGQHEMIDGFIADTTVLKLKTVKITYNANAAQEGIYFVSGLFAPYSLKAGEGPQQLTAIPGIYGVDNLSNTGGGNEDFAFMVDELGNTSAIESTFVYEKETYKRNGAEYAEYKESEVRPRIATVRFRIEASDRINFHVTHKAVNLAVTENLYEFEMPMTIGAGGVNIWSFGKWEITGGDVVRPNGKPARGLSGANDYQFLPILRYDLEKKAFYFQGEQGAVQTITGEAAGFYDGNENPLTVKVTATIVPPPPAKPDAGEAK